MNIEEKLLLNIKETVQELYNITPEDKMLMIEIPKDSSNGDYSSNIAMRLTKLVGKKPQDIAAEIKETLLRKTDNVNSIEIAGPGFINFWMKKDALANVINTVIDLDEDYGKSNTGKGLKVLEEYVSANPTGILHCGHARGAAWGDSCVNIMKAAGYDVTREYYINDAGAQITNLGLSLLARYRELFGLDFTLPEDGYHGQDVIEIAKKIKETDGDRWLKVSEQEAVNHMKAHGLELELERIRNDLAYYGVKFDSWISEQSFYKQGKVEEIVEKMKNMDLLYEKEDAIWFKSTEYGDEKDRVLKKSDGSYTYMTPDIANHAYKYDRGYDILVNIWGADHHGYVPRMKAAMKALGYNADNLYVDLCQMVRLIENGEEVKMSKRTGNAVTIREIVDDIGVDAARYLFVCKSLDTHFDLDLTLAKQKTNENPVYYAQYAHARICSVLRQANKKPEKKDSYNLLTSDKEADLLKHINSFTDVITDAAITRAPNKVCNYIQKLATYFHSFYGSCRVIDPENPELSDERLALCEATRITMRNALTLIGVSAPDKM